MSDVTTAPLLLLLLYAIVSSCAMITPPTQWQSPRHVSLSLSPDNTQLRVTWSTPNATHAPVVRWWETASSYAEKRTAAANVSEFTVTDQTNPYSSWIYRGIMTNLSAGASYSSMVGSAASWSQVFVFKAPPGVSSMGSPFRLLAVADMSADSVDGGFGGVAHALAREVSRGDYDMILHGGDLAYDLHADRGTVGDEFMMDIQPVASRVPYMVAPGNHESFDNFSHFKNRFTMPGWETRENLFWSVDAGPVHFIIYNTEAYFDGPVNATVSEQYRWLEEDLQKAQANRAAVPWIIVQGHRPFYCNVAGTDPTTGERLCDGEQEQSRIGPTEQRGLLGMEDLFYKYGVDLALFGHVHDYSRYFPVYNHTVLNGTADPKEPFTDPRATVYLTIGGAGNPEMPQPPKNKQCSAWDMSCMHMRSTPWSVCEMGYFPKCPNFNYGRATVVNTTHLHWEQVSVTIPGKFDNTTLVRNATVAIPGHVIDEMWLVQRKHGPFG